MPVLLRRSSDYPGAFDAWFAVTGTEGRGPADKKVAELGQGLDDAFNSIRPEWWSAGKALADGPRRLQSSRTRGTTLAVSMAKPKKCRLCEATEK